MNSPICKSQETVECSWFQCSQVPRIVRDLSLNKSWYEVDQWQGMNFEWSSLHWGIGWSRYSFGTQCTDHGIELPGVRGNENKPIAGSLFYVLAPKGGRMVVDVKHDGGRHWSRKSEGQGPRYKALPAKKKLLLCGKPISKLLWRQFFLQQSKLRMFLVVVLVWMW